MGKSFYDRETAVVAEELIGKRIRRTVGRHVHEARIVETEAYLGLKDPACHLFGGFSPRTEGTWGRPGVAYVFTIYGIHRCFNAITLSEEPFGGVLVRAAELVDARCCGFARQREKGSGPGRLARALSIDAALNGHDLRSRPLQILSDRHAPKVVRGPRVGISRATSRRLRFAESRNPWVSKPQPPASR